VKYYNLPRCDFNEGFSHRRNWQAEDDYDHPKVPISDVGTEELPPLIQQQQWLSFF